MSNPSDDEMALFAQLDDVFSNVDDEGVQNIQDHSTPYLIRRLNEIKDRLFELGQAIHLNPTSQEARDLHSEYYACRLELRRRGA